jgi:hypothetical protein
MSAFDEFDVCRKILESLLAGVCVVDMKKKIVLWSDGAERITGDSVTKSLAACASGKPSCTVRNPAASSAAKNPFWRRPGPIPKKSGRNRFLPARWYR